MAHTPSRPTGGSTDNPHIDPASSGARFGFGAADISSLVRAGPLTWLDLTVAAVALARANRRLRKLSTEQILGHLRDRSDPASDAPLAPEKIRRVDRIGKAVTRAGPRLPFRADCLIQAEAARALLLKHDIASRIHIGVRRDESGAFLAHAWLSVGEHLVTGGNVAPYTELGRDIPAAAPDKLP